LPLPGISPVLLAQDGSVLEGEAEGYLAIDRPWPGMLRSTYGDHARCHSTYFAPYKGYYFTGDGAKRNAEGEYRIIGRVDDVINVSGHRFGTAEIENAINMHGNVIESAVVGYPHALKGQGIFAFVIADGPHTQAEIIAGIAATITAQIGPIAKPDKVLVVDALPKTRSGKIMRRILRKIAEGEYQSLGDTSTLLDPDLVGRIVAAAQATS
jgi:acetyl-CoA synthetase